MVAPGKLIPVSVAARILCVSRRAVYEMLQDGRLTLVKTGHVRGYRVRRGELERIIGERICELQEQK